MNKQFRTYFTEEAIVSYICKLRVIVASNRNKKHLIHLLTESENFNYHVKDQKKYFDNADEETNEFIKYQHAFLTELHRILPSRKKWVTLGRFSRTNKRTNQPISSSDRNYYSLKKTVKKYRKESPEEPWLIELNKFILDIQNSVETGTCKIKSPVVYPKLKEKISYKKKNKCRPISLFSLKDRVILSQTNKFLTVLFDDYFQDCSYAFRSKKNKDNKTTLSHHDCIRDILEYRNIYENRALWVVECDMEKFYDSVNHKIIKELFSELMDRVKVDFPELELIFPAHIFNEFLDCYSFNKNVPLKSDLSYWKKYKIPKGEFEWVGNRFKELGYYENVGSERIGVPQGGALSGLIANIVLNKVDIEVLKTNVFYARFCDDMIIVHPERKECEVAKKEYINTLQKLKLVPHAFCEDYIQVGFNWTLRNLLNSISRKVFSFCRFVKYDSWPIVQWNRTMQENIKRQTRQFWQEKSKGPYKWASFKDNGYPWIGFVGYELHFEGHIRVRKKSLHKELNKQKEVIYELKKAISDKRRKSIGTISESVIHRLVGMSVGRINLRNYTLAENDLCWKNGFRELRMNSYSARQMKILDRSRNKHYYTFVKELKNLEKIEKTNAPSKARQIIHFNKPFSYYYQVLERSMNKQILNK